MCKTEVEMIRARETVYDDDGHIQEVKIVTGKGRYFLMMPKGSGAGAAAASYVP